MTIIGLAHKITDSPGHQAQPGAALRSFPAMLRLAGALGCYPYQTSLTRSVRFARNT